MTMNLSGRDVVLIRKTGENVSLRLLFCHYGRTTLSGGSLIIEFEKVEAVCVGKSLRPLMVS